MSHLAEHFMPKTHRDATELDFLLCLFNWGTEPWYIVYIQMETLTLYVYKV